MFPLVILSYFIYFARFFPLVVFSYNNDICLLDARDHVRSFLPVDIDEKPLIVYHLSSGESTKYRFSISLAASSHRRSLQEIMTTTYIALPPS